jgi:hypothetical protein
LYRWYPVWVTACPSAVISISTQFWYSPFFCSAVGRGRGLFSLFKANGHEAELWKYEALYPISCSVRCHPVSAQESRRPPLNEFMYLHRLWPQCSPYLVSYAGCSKAVHNLHSSCANVGWHLRMFLYF